MLLPQCDLRQVAEGAGFDLEFSAERAAATGFFLLRLRGVLAPE